MLNKKEGESNITYDSYDFTNFKLYVEKMRDEARERWNYKYAYKVSTSSSGGYLEAIMNS